MTAEHILDYMSKITLKFPKATDFGPSASTTRELRNHLAQNIGLSEIYTPASREAVEKYVDTEYPDWISKCERFLENYHEILNFERQKLTFRFQALNDGTRPAKDVLVRIAANGRFLISPPPASEDDSADSANERRSTLPYPPQPPTGKWKPLLAGKFLFPDPYDHIQSVRSQLDLLGRQDYFRSIDMANHKFNRDPNQFYYKPDRSSIPDSTFYLEIQQWRHGIDPATFFGEISFDTGQQLISGALECQIHAENISQFVRSVVPIKINISHVNASIPAIKLLEDFLQGP